MLKQSEQIANLAAALSQAQSEIEGAVKDSKNPFFKSNYADLSSIMEAVRFPLSKNGLSVTQLTTILDGQFCIVTRLMHKSGEWLEGVFPVTPAKQNDPQSVGSAMTYARRYALAAALSVPQLDDDGNLASGKFQSMPMAPVQQPKPVSPLFNTYVKSGGEDVGNYVIKIGTRFLNKKLDQLKPTELRTALDAAVKIPNKSLDEKEFVTAVSKYLDEMEEDALSEIKF